MYKLLSSLVIGLAVTVLVGAPAYALFSSTITLTGFTITTGSAGLQVESAPGVFTADTWDAQLLFANVYPGYSQQATITLKNASTAPIDLVVKAQLTTPTGDWEVLKDVIQMRARNAASTSASTGYKTLAQWNAEDGMSLPSSVLAHGQTRSYVFDVIIDDSYGNEIANKTLSEMSLVFTGVQDD